ncbi:MAG TPA: DJ-1/PfpI family protein [Terriglobales bacterium]|nr:DJ-1/PfpI family protein [Terriglobales bacterium]
MTKPQFTIGILVFDDVEELDFVGPMEVFGIAAKHGAPCKAVLVAKTHAEVRAHFGLTFKPDATFASCPPLDLLIVPGGPGARGPVRHDGATLEFVRKQPGEVASVCTGALILAASHVLDGKRATTHRSRVELLREYNAITVDADARVIFDGRIATSAGITAGIDLALAIVQRHWGEELSGRVAETLEWDRAGQWKTARV